jgi:hypothetical protein
MRNFTLLSLLLLSLTSTAIAAPLRIVQAIPLAGARSAPLIDLYMDGLPLVGRLPYGQMTTLAEAPTGIHSYSIRSGGTVLAERSLNFNTAAPLGHFLALAGDGRNQPHALIAWQRPSAPPGLPGYININDAMMHLAIGWTDPVEVAISGVAPPPSIDAARFIRQMNLQSYGEPSAGGLSSVNSAGLVEQVSVMDASHGLVALRGPTLLPGDYVLTHFLIGNGAPATPFEWLSVRDSQVIARGSGSYASGPALASTRYFFYDGRPGSGFYLDTVDAGDRLVGFLFGIGADLKSTWQLLDGPRISASEYRMQALTADASGFTPEWILRFVTCDEVIVERYEGNRLVDSDLVRRSVARPDCTEFRPL